MATKPLASLSLDLDNQWSYMKTHGDAGWETFPSYLDTFVPYVLDALQALDLRITFFVVGQDAALERNRGALRLIARQGHEIGNHSFHHEQWMVGHGRDRIAREVSDAAEAITAATGQQPRGFRGPGFSWSADLLDVLDEAGYLYDASTFPTYIGPLARRYYFHRTDLSAEEMAKRDKLFGGFSEGRRSIKPYFWGLPSGHLLLEIPVTTMPLFKIPFHLSYLMHLSQYSPALMLLYLQASLRLCRLTGTEPSFLLHPLDLLGPEQAPKLRFFPGMNLSAQHKMSMFLRVLGELGKHFTLITMGEHARRIRERDIPVRNLPTASLTSK